MEEVDPVEQVVAEIAAGPVERPKLTEQEMLRLAVLKLEAQRRSAYRFYRYFPDCKPECKKNSPHKEDHAGFCRCLYVKHIQFMDAGNIFSERLFMAANRIGKTEAAAYEVVCHLTGLYPHWWKGFRFPGRIRLWVAGETMETTRNIVQVALLGPHKDVPQREWTGMIPAHLIRDYPTRRSGGVTNCIDTMEVKHVSGAYSSCSFKSFDQGERGFQGTEQDLVWLDEQCPDDIYNECMIRLMTTGGRLITTFTPLQGLTDFIQHYLETAVMLDTDGEPKQANDIFWPADREIS